MRLVARASDIGIFTEIARNPRRLVYLAGSLGALSLVYALAVEAWITRASGSVVLNQTLITVQFGLLLVAGYAQALALACRLFGDAWRRHVLLGEAVGEDVGDDLEETAAATRDRTTGLLLLVMAMMAVNYGLMHVATGNYVGEYYRNGFFVSMLRSDASSDRVEGLKGIVSPFNNVSRDHEVLVAEVARAVADADDEVAGWAAWTAGLAFMPGARDALVARLETGPDTVRADAALALGRLGDLRGERVMIEQIAASHDARLLYAAALGLGAMSSVAGAEAIAPRLGDLDGDVLPVAVWAAGRARTTSIREPALAFWQIADDDAERCAAAELLKHATNVDDYDTMRTAFSSVDPNILCEEVVFTDRSFRHDVVGERFKFVVGEPLAAKYMIAAFNIGGDNLREWLEAIAYDDRQRIEVRRLAYLLFEEMATMPSRPPRR